MATAELLYPMQSFDVDELCARFLTDKRVSDMRPCIECGDDKSL